MSERIRAQEQAARGWSQNWEKWAPSRVWTAPSGASGHIIALDFTGGAVVRAAKRRTLTDSVPQIVGIGVK